MRSWSIFEKVQIETTYSISPLTGAIGSPAEGLLVLFVFVGLQFLGVQVQHRRLRTFARMGMLGGVPFAEALGVYARSRSLIAHCDVHGKLFSRARLKLALLSNGQECFPQIRELVLYVWGLLRSVCSRMQRRDCRWAME